MSSQDVHNPAARLPFLLLSTCTELGKKAGSRQTGVTITKFPITITITSKMSGFFERKITLNDRQNEWDCLSFDYQSRKSLGNCNSFGFGIDTALAAAAAPIFPFSPGRGAHFPIFRHFEVCCYQPCIFRRLRGWVFAQCAQQLTRTENITENRE